MYITADAIAQGPIHSDLLLLNDHCWVLSHAVGIPSYDFSFERYFNTKHPIFLPDSLTAFARIGPFVDYANVYNHLRLQGIELINSPSQHALIDDLRQWYPVIKELTPFSLWFDHEPIVEKIADEIGFPVFVKGARQTSAHQKKLAIANDQDSLQELLLLAKTDPMLATQPLVFRKYIPLRPLPGNSQSPDERLPGSREFRTFWYHTHCLGIGRYWHLDPAYSLEPHELPIVENTAKKAALRLNAPFVVIDVAQTLEGDWIVIECNDAQESGYAGISPIHLWSTLLDTLTAPVLPA